MANIHMKTKTQTEERRVGVIQLKDLATAFPALAQAYKNTYGSKRPDIRIKSDTSFTFPVETYHAGSWNEIYFFKNGHIVQSSSHDSSTHGRSVAIASGGMVLDCVKGNVNYCELIIHPDGLAQLLPSKDELSADEKLVLKCFEHYKSFARKDEFYNTKYRLDGFGHSESGEYETLVKELVKKGYLKANSAGNTQITIKGKNA